METEIKEKTIKEKTIEIIDQVLRKRKKYYLSTDFSFKQIEGFCLTYQGRIMNRYLREKGFMTVTAKHCDKALADKVRSTRNVWIKYVNFINQSKN